MVLQAEAQVAQARATVGLKEGVPDDQLDPSQGRAGPAGIGDAGRSPVQCAARQGTGWPGRADARRDSIARVGTARGRGALCLASLNAVQEQIALLKLRRAELAMAMQNREDAVLKAPFDGIIQETHVAPGSYVNVGQTVAALVRIDPLRFRAGVPERSADWRDRGPAAGNHDLEGQPEPLKARISRISPALDVSSRALIIEADIDNAEGRLRTGLFAEAEILVDTEQQALAVPARSIVSFGGVEKVWTVSRQQGPTAADSHGPPGRRTGRSARRPRARRPRAVQRRARARGRGASHSRRTRPARQRPRGTTRRLSPRAHGATE